LEAGILKKKGLVFWNKRHVTLDNQGLLKYYDTKNRLNPRATIDLTSPFTHILYKTSKTETIKVVTPD
jgi:hypothetical protein